MVSVKHWKCMKVRGDYVVSTSKTDDALRLISTASFDIWPQNQWVQSNFQSFSLPRLQPHKISMLWKQDCCAFFSRCLEDLWSLPRLIFEAKMQSHLEATRNIWTLKLPLCSEPVCNSHQCLMYCMKGGVATHQCSYAMHFKYWGQGTSKTIQDGSYRVV